MHEHPALGMPQSAPDELAHHCDTCGKSFSTNSHLRRHEALHTGRTAAVCPSCNRSFSRLDTARRHVKACSPGSIDPLVNGSRRGKVRQACDTCAQRKLSCDSVFPCTRCLSSGASCTYQRRTYGVSRPASSTDTSTRGLTPSEPHISLEHLRLLHGKMFQFRSYWLSPHPQNMSQPRRW